MCSNSSSNGLSFCGITHLINWVSSIWQYFIVVTWVWVICLICMPMLQILCNTSRVDSLVANMSVIADPLCIHAWKIRLWLGSNNVVATILIINGWILTSWVSPLLYLFVISLLWNLQTKILLFDLDFWLVLTLDLLIYTALLINC